MATNSVRQSGAVVEFPYSCCRNISAPEDNGESRKILAGHAPASSFLKFEDNENVREYLVDRPGKQRKKPTLVHRAIRDTLYNFTDRFSILNGGICLVAHDADIDEKNKVIRLRRASIINGSQTQGELRRYFERTADGRSRNADTDDLADPSVTFEIIVTKDDDLVAEISIARNFQNHVKDLSIAGRRGQLDALESALQGTFPEAKLRKAESDVSDEFLDTEKLIQVLFAMSPEAAWERLDKRDRLGSKTAAYSQKTRCLKMFQRIVDNAESEDGTTAFKTLYQYFLDMAGPSWELYEQWKTHQVFKGSGLHKIERDKKGNVLNVPDGIVFPILASLSAFVVFNKGKWRYAPPSSFDDKELYGAAKDNYIEVAKSNPQTMGKTKASYSNLYRITSIYSKMAAEGQS